ncbi:MAG TPA: rRNA maturation RNase YbeY [Candidatus Scatomonas merdigallinarum]|nr:rRNA maturation RNase YbeY [Candidatus Scatomonas merdigallinarum]
MTLQTENEQEQELGFDWKALAEQVARKVLETEKCPYESEISLTLTDNREIRRLNREFRGLDKATDVLSFPLVNFRSPGDYGMLEAEEADSFNPESGELMLGDIVISVERAMEQAAEYGHSLKREIGFLIAHSMLHLLGYDHMEPQEAAVMEQKQEAVLEALGIRRPPYGE